MLILFDLAIKLAVCGVHIFFAAPLLQKPSHISDDFYVPTNSRDVARERHAEATWKSTWLKYK